MKQIILTLSIILLVGLSTPVISQEKTSTVEKKVMIIKSADVDAEKGENIWISKEGESIDLKGQDMIFVGEDSADSDSEKEVSVNVNKEMRDGKNVRIFDIAIKENGKKKSIKWEDNGTIPTDVAAMLEAEGIDIQMLQSDKVTVTVDATEDLKESDRSMDVNMEAKVVNGVTERTVDLSIEENGEKQVMKWTDNGETPAEIQKKLDELGIDLDSVGVGEHRKDVEVIVEKIENSSLEINEEDGKVEKKIYKIDLSNGEALPVDIREQLEKYGVDIDAIIEEAKEQNEDEKRVEKKVRIIKRHSGEMGDADIEIFRLQEGEEIPENINQKLKDQEIDIESLKSGDFKINSKKSRKHIIKIKDENGEMRVMEWNGEGEMPAEMKEHMKKMEKEGHTLHLHSKSNGPMNKAQLGVMIEDSELAGVLVSDIVPMSAAAKVGIVPGDIMTHIDGLSVIDTQSLLQSLSKKIPGDQVEITYTRDELSNKVIAYLTDTKKIDSAKVEVIQITKNCDTNSLTRDDDIDVLFKSIVDVEKVDNGGKNMIIIREAEELHEVENTQTTEIRKLPKIEKHKRLALQDFKAYPNPTSGFVNISFEGKSSPIVVQLSDFSGRIIFKETLNNFSGSFNRDIDLSTVLKGQFILYVIQDQKIFIESVMVQ